MFSDYLDYCCSFYLAGVHKPVTVVTENDFLVIEQLILLHDDKNMKGGGCLDLLLRRTSGDDYDLPDDAFLNWLDETKSYWAEHDGSLVMGYYDDPFADVQRIAKEASEGQSSFVQAAIGSGLGSVEHLPIIPLGICDIVAHSIHKAIDRRDPLQLIINPISMIASGMVHGAQYVMDKGASWVGGSLDGRSSFEVSHEVTSTLMMAGLIVMGLRGIGRGGRNFFDGMKGSAAAIASGMRPMPAYVTAGSSGAGGAGISIYNPGVGYPSAGAGFVYMAAARPDDGKTSVVGKKSAKIKTSNSSSNVTVGDNALLVGSRSKPHVLKNKEGVYSVVIDSKEIPFQKVSDGRVLVQHADGEILVDARGKVISTVNKPTVLRMDDGTVLVVDRNITQAAAIYDDAHVVLPFKNGKGYRCLDYEGNVVNGSADQAVIVRDLKNNGKTGIAFIEGRSNYGEFTNNGLFHYVMNGKHEVCLPSGRRLNIESGEPILLIDGGKEFVLLDKKIFHSFKGDVVDAPGSLRFVIGENAVLRTYARGKGFRFSRNVGSDGWQIKDYESLVYRGVGEETNLVGFARNGRFFEVKAESDGVLFFRESGGRGHELQRLIAADFEGTVLKKSPSWSAKSIINDFSGEPAVITEGGQAFFVYSELTDGNIYYAKSLKFGEYPGDVRGWKLFRIEDGVPKALSQKELISRFEKRLSYEDGIFKGDALERPISVEAVSSSEMAEFAGKTGSADRGIIGWQIFETPVGNIRGGVAGTRVVFSNAAGEKHGIMINHIKRYELPDGIKRTGRIVEDIYGEAGMGLDVPSPQKVISELSKLPWSALTRCEQVTIQPTFNPSNEAALGAYLYSSRNMVIFPTLKRYIGRDVKNIINHEIGHALEGEIASLMRSSVEAMIIDGVKSDLYIGNALGRKYYFKTKLEERFAEGVAAYLGRGPNMSSRAPRMTRLIEQRLASALEAGGNMSLLIFILSSLNGETDDEELLNSKKDESL